MNQLSFNFQQVEQSRVTLVVYCKRLSLPQSTNAQQSKIVEIEQFLFLLGNKSL